MKSAENAQLSNNGPFVTELMFSKGETCLKYYIYRITTVFILVIDNSFIIEPKRGELPLKKDNNKLQISLSENFKLCNWWLKIQ